MIRRGERAARVQPPPLRHSAAVVHLRIVTPADRAARVVELLLASPATSSLAHLPGASLQPPGDLVLADVAREETSVLVAQLRELGLEQDGSITLDTNGTVLADRARDAERFAAGAPADAVLWEELESRTSTGAQLSFTYLGLMALATMIASVGILTDSLVLIIGAMVVGPEFGPLAGLAVACVQRRLDLARRSLLALAVGFPVAILLAGLGALALRVSGVGPAQLAPISHPETIFISDPNRYSAIVAVLAGIAGMLALTTTHTGALIGVLISVTTIPAAGNIGVAAAYGEWTEFRGALAQLAINLVTILVACLATLRVQRSVYARRQARALRRRVPA